MSSFEPEYIISLDSKDQKYSPIYRVCQPTSVWGALQARAGQKVSVNTRTVAMSQEPATSVARLFNAFISQVRYPAPEHHIRSDGTTYTFITFETGVGTRGGSTWSPTAGTRMAALVSIIERLRQLAAAPTDAQLQTELLREAQRLGDRLK